MSDSTRQANLSVHRTGLQPFATRSRRVLCAVCAALSLTFIASSLTPPPAKAAFPGRNGLIAVPIKNNPEVALPENYVDDYDLFTLSPGGTGLTRLTSGPTSDIDPAWSPDGMKVAFARATPFAAAADIYVMDRDGSNLVNLTNSPQHDDYAPDWSPDGKRIVFTHWPNWPAIVLSSNSLISPGGDLYVMDADGTNMTPLVEAAGFQDLPAWSPNGEWIAFSDSSNETIEMIRPDGSDQRSLTRRDRFEFSPFEAEWSPDGKWIAFAASSPPSDTDVWVVRFDGKRLQNLTLESSSQDQSASWSPDGTQIVFISDRDGGWRLFKMRPDGSAVRNVVEIDLQTAQAGPDWGPRP